MRNTIDEPSVEDDLDIFLSLSLSPSHRASINPNYNFKKGPKNSNSWTVFGYTIFVRNPHVLTIHTKLTMKLTGERNWAQTLSISSKPTRQLELQFYRVNCLGVAK